MKNSQADVIQTALSFEARRKQLLGVGKFKEALATYRQQRVFLPDKNTGRFWDAKFRQSIQHPMEDWRIKTIVRLINPNQSVINLGVGRGKLEIEIFATYPWLAHYTATDITDQTLHNLKKSLPAIRYIKTPLTKLPFKANTFDQVLLLEVLEHIKPSETFRVLKEAYRILNPGGRFLISVPVNEGLEQMLPTNPNSHMRLYSESLLKFELENTGFSIEKIYQASAFASQFRLKHFINRFLHIRQPNNILLVCRKS